LRVEIIQRAAGIPFYLEEILRMLIDDQVITFNQGQWHFNSEADTNKLGVPDNLQALILARFDRLDTSLARTLQVASVIGNEFSLPVLSKVMQQDENELREKMIQLVRRAFLETNMNGAFSDFSFCHVLTSDAILGTLLRRDASELHGKIGSAIEELYPERLNDTVYALARHYSFSRNLEKALHYLSLAGEYAARDYLTAQARDYFEQAYGLIDQFPDHHEESLRIHIGLGDVLVYCGEYENARLYFEKALELIDTNDPVQINKHIALRRKISTTYERKGDFIRALEQLDVAQKIITNSTLSCPVEAAKNLNNIGWINFRRGELGPAEENLTAALGLVENSTQYDVIASIYNRLGGIFYQKDDLEQSSYYVRKSLVLREEIGDSGAVARCYNNLGLLAWKRGNWDDALDDFTRSMELNKKLGDVEAVIFLHNNIGLLQTDKGNLDTASEHLRESLTGSQQIGHIALEGEAYLHFSRYWLAAEEWEKSLSYSHRALKIFSEIGSQDRLVDLHASIGEAWYGLGEIEKATSAGQEALQIINEHFDLEPSTLGRARILRLMGNISRVKGDTENALRDLKASVTLFTGLKNQLELGRTYGDLVLLEKERGNLTKARIYAREARYVFRKLGAKIDEAKIESMSESLR
jgi:predicted ATPase